MDSYGVLARFYDRLTADADDGARAAYLLALFAKHGKPVQTLLDVACGTGRLTQALLAAGVDTVGVDRSEEMLSLARQRAPEALFICQDMQQLDLYGCAQGAVCVMDSFNHLWRSEQARAFLTRLRLFVEPGGLFIFDVNTPYKHRQVLADNTFVFEQEDLVCVWQNRLQVRGLVEDMRLDFFVRQADGRYQRLSDSVKEKAYTDKALQKMLRECGWQVLAVYEDMTMQPPAADSQRAVYVVRNTRTREEAEGNG